MIKTMTSRGFYVLCYNEQDYQQKKGETKKIGPFKEVTDAWYRRRRERITGHWYYVEVVEKVIV
jgi:hypothetical protein